MVSIHLIRKYKLTAPQYVERFHEAIADARLVWSPVHKAHYTQVGYVSINQLKKLGLYDTAHPEDFIFMTKSEMRKKHAEFKAASRKRSIKQIYGTFYIWLKLNPKGDITTVTEEEFVTLKENIHRLRILWKEMRSRCSNPNALDYQWYGAKGVKVCDEWSGPDGSDAFVVWSLKHGYEWHRGIERGDQMSIDRLDPDKDYSPENCRYIPLRDNCLRATRRRLSNTTTYKYAMNWNGRNLKYRSMFPDCVRKGTPNANGSVDWTKVFDNYFSTMEEFEEWLYREGFSKVTILSIRRKLNKRNMAIA